VQPKSRLAHKLHLVARFLRNGTWSVAVFDGRARLHKRSVSQRSDSHGVSLVSCIAKKYCITIPNRDTFVQC
jgi:hypothetical protein